MHIPTRRALAAGAVALIAAMPAGAQAPGNGEATPVPAAVLRVEPERPRLPLSRLDLPPEDLGFAGARLATEDNRTTGTFLGQDFTLEEVSTSPDEAVATLEELTASGIQFVVTMADADTLLELSDAVADEDVILFNATAPDDRLRGEDCRANVFHTIPSRAMFADALAQFLMVKRWDRWFLVEGSHEADTALADAYRRAAEKFGANIVESRVFEDTGGARRTDAGHVQVQAQMPVFTQRAPEHHVLVAADESEVFGSYLPYHTWDPRPVAGSAGLRPTTWHPAHEAWAGMQMQSRFDRLASRPMRPEDFNVWVALRSIGEAATRTNSTDFASLRDYMLGDEFQLGAFKGVAVSYRQWDNQLRQPILLAHDNMVVSVSPQDQYVHQFSPLDSLGVDEPETTCSF